MACPQDCTATGTVRRIYARAEGTFIWLKDFTYGGPPGANGEGYFRLLRSHPNYNALYSLLLVAATNKHPLRIRTEKDISPSEDAEVNYLVVDDWGA
jgi:hypothetical protein